MVPIVASSSLEEAEALMMEAKARFDTETFARKEHRGELQQLEEELASQQQLLFQVNVPAQLPPEAWLKKQSMRSRSAFLSALDKGVKMARAFSATSQANELVS